MGAAGGGTAASGGAPTSSAGTGGSGDARGGNGIVSVGGSSGAQTTGDAGAADVDDMSACAKWSQTSHALPSILQLVIDTSASMGYQPLDGGSTKWVLARQALGKTFGALPADTAIGILFYPGVQSTPSPTPVDSSACVATDKMLPIALLGDQNSDERTALTNALNAVMPNGETPTHDAYDYALTHGLDMSSIQGARFMVLLTDGAPTFALGCVGDSTALNMVAPTDPIVDEIAQANQRGIRTFVVGAPGSEVSLNGEDARRWLSQAARAGGTPLDGCSDEGPNYCHIDLSQSNDLKTALTDALASIAGDVLPCNYALPEPPSGQKLDSANINVFYSTPDAQTPELIERNESTTCVEGWRLDGAEVTLCPDTCRKVRETANSTVKLLFGCASVLVR